MRTNLKNSKLRHIMLTSLCLTSLVLFQSYKSGTDTFKDSNFKSETSAIEKDINKVIAEAYKVWYVAKGDQPNFSMFNTFYTSSAIIQDFGKNGITVSRIADGIEEFKKAFEAGHLTSFDEREIGAETKIFGNVAQRISYHIYHTNADSITKRGVNSIQLVRINNIWKVHSILRQIESDSYSLPKLYDDFR